MPPAGAQEVSAKLDGPIIVLKGPKDAISDGRQTIFCAEEGSKRRAGGQVLLVYITFGMVLIRLEYSASSRAQISSRLVLDE